MEVWIMGSHLKEFVKELMWQRNLSNKIDIHAMGSQVIESAILISIADVVRIRWKYRKLVEVYTNTFFRNILEI